MAFTPTNYSAINYLNSIYSYNYVVRVGGRASRPVNATNNLSVSDLECSAQINLTGWDGTSLFYNFPTTVTQPPLAGSRTFNGFIVRRGGQNVGTQQFAARVLYQLIGPTTITLKDTTITQSISTSTSPTSFTFQFGSTSTSAATVGPGVYTLRVTYTLRDNTTPINHTFNPTSRDLGIIILERDTGNALFFGCNF